MSDIRQTNIMPQRKEQFENKGIYHIVLRGIDGNIIFKDTNDYYRGIFSIYEFNNKFPIEIIKRRRDRAVEKKREKNKLAEVGHPPIIIDKREKFVDVFTFCLMPNHIHLLLKQKKDNGITEFMRKFGGYGRYLNKKYKRRGYVFQDAFKSIRIKDDNQLMIVFNYIHANPISLYNPGWKEKGIKNINKSIRFLENYKWSSYQDYIGMKNFPSVTERNFLLEFISGESGCKDAMKNWLEYKNNLAKNNNLFLEE